MTLSTRPSTPSPLDYNEPMQIGSQARDRLKRAMPHLMGLYAMLGLLTAVNVYNRPLWSASTRVIGVTYAACSGVVWPLHWLVRGAVQAHHTLFKENT
jgi:hypothetical protein